MLLMLATYCEGALRCALALHHTTQSAAQRPGYGLPNDGAGMVASGSTGSGVRVGARVLVGSSGSGVGVYERCICCSGEPQNSINAMT